MNITFVELPEGLNTDSGAWEVLRSQVDRDKTDVLVTNEMPFGRWLCSSETYDPSQADESILAHDAGVKALINLNLPLVLSSRPIACNEKLANEAFALTADGYQFAHQKQYFPDEPGFYETAWFQTEKKGFDVIQSQGITIGFMLCTEVMFSEWARAYRRQGAHLIVVPRATGQSYDKWRTAASMAAIVSGCYVVSSNRVGQVGESPIFGGKGFAFAPDGSLIAETSTEQPYVTFELDPNWVRKQQTLYPCYVKEAVM